MSFVLKAACSEDIPTLSQLGNMSPEPDLHTRLKSRYGYNHAKVMAAALHDWLSRPPTRCQVVKAVNSSTGEILGWITWGYRGYNDARQTPHRVTGRVFQNESESDRTVKTIGVARLEEVTSSDMQHWMDFLMPEGTKCMFIQSVSVAPAHQGKGIGTALVNYGTLQADRDGVFCWVHSSAAGSDFFAKVGFEEIGRLDVDLDEFAREEETSRQNNIDRIRDAREASGEQSYQRTSYGRYVFRYMKRPAQNVD